MKPPKIQGVLGIVAACLLGVVIGAAGSSFFKEHIPPSFLEERAAGQYRFVSPLLSCGEVKMDDLDGGEQVKLETDLTDFINTEKSNGNAVTIGVYFRQLKGGPWLGVNYEKEFTPGSLLKVPLAMALYNAKEVRPGFLEQQVLYEGPNIPENQYFKDETIQPGTTYTVQALIEDMLTKSDNNAAILLTKVLSEQEFFDTYNKLGIAEPSFGQDYVTTVRYYASFFRVLYNATYLSATDSERLLEILTHTTFTKGLVAGVPPSVPVAHKFGERSLEGSALVQLHDCGIVYHPTRPYLLCVMTQGRDFDTLARVIKDISEIVYTHVD